MTRTLKISLRTASRNSRRFGDLTKSGHDGCAREGRCDAAAASEDGMSQDEHWYKPCENHILVQYDMISMWIHLFSLAI